MASQGSQKRLSAKEKLSVIVRTLSATKDVEALIKTKFASEAPLLTTIPEYLFDLGGKRIRPVLALLVGQALGYEKPPTELVEVAAGIELIHLATLLHDDIIDKSPVRRHEESPFLRYGIGDTLLAGDFLLVRAFSLCAKLDRFIIDATERACIELTEGEILEKPLNEWGPTLNESLNISKKKTASLFRLAAESAAHICTRGNKQTVRAFAEFGEHLGIAFQVLDDVLDVTSTEDLLGKRAGSDIIEKKPSPVNVLWLQTKSPLALKLLKSSEIPSNEVAMQSIAEIKASSVVSDAVDLARSYADSAASALKEAEQLNGALEKRAKEALFSIIDFVIERSA